MREETPGQIEISIFITSHISGVKGDKTSFSLLYENFILQNEKFPLNAPGSNIHLYINLFYKFIHAMC